MQVLPEGTSSGTLIFDNDNLFAIHPCGQLHLTGTLYNAAGERQDGWFATDILKVDDHVVYWLVERTGGTGARINPGESDYPDRAQRAPAIPTLRLLSKIRKRPARTCLFIRTTA